MAVSGTYDFSLTNAEIVTSAYAFHPGVHWLGARQIPVLFSQIDHSVKFAVYCAVNLENGKIYIGATSKGISARRANHFCRAKRGENGVFLRAIRKYGRDNFEFVMLKKCDGWGDTLASERDMIATYSPEYNVALGGGGVYGLKHSIESKEKMRAAKIGKPSVWSTTTMPADLRHRIAETRRSERGRKVSDAARLQSLRTTTIMMNERRRRRVVCVTDGQTFASFTEAAGHYGLTTGAISWLCDRPNNSRRGLSFRREETIL